MARARRPSQGLAKAPTGIVGLDAITGGGLPVGRTTLVSGGAGCGKTVLALQSLVHGASLGERGLFVAFEEQVASVVANASSFGWDLPALSRRALTFVDAQPSADLVAAGTFDLGGLLAVLDAKVRATRARRIVLDSVDALLGLLDDPAAERRELHRLHEWLLHRKLTAILSLKTPPTALDGLHEYVQFMVDCAITLDRRVVGGISQRALRVLKYRGSAFYENEAPMIIGPTGLAVAGLRGATAGASASTERVTTGVSRLDTMLRGGYYRGAGVLITGSPGTAKTTLCGTFAEAACRRRERTLFISFDSEPSEIVRNLRSVNIELEPHVRSGMLRMHSERTTISSAEVHLMNIRALVAEHRCRCLVIDPLSALGKASTEAMAQSVVERLMDWSKSLGLTVLCTSLLASDDPETESTPLHISTIADTWIHLSYVVNAGERNRALTIVKSRGTAHSNQVRELLLSDEGVTLSDVYTSDGQVLMGSLRWQRERAEADAHREHQRVLEQKRLEIALAEAELEERVRLLQREMALKRAELELLERSREAEERAAAAGAAVMRERRGADADATTSSRRRRT